MKGRGSCLTFLSNYRPLPLVQSPNLEMNKPSFLETLTAPLLAAAITLAGTAWMTNSQNARSDNERFIDGAQETAQETSQLLYAGYNELEKLVQISETQGWKTLANSPQEQAFLDFHRRWRQQLIAEHFKVARYFGKHMANDLVHIDKIDTPKVSDHKQSASSEVDQNTDMATLADQIEFASRLISLTQDIFDEAHEQKRSEDLFPVLQDGMRHKEQARALLNHYDTETVRYLRRMDDYITQLGKPKVTVIYTKAD